MPQSFKNVLLNAILILSSFSIGGHLYENFREQSLLKKELCDVKANLNVLKETLEYIAYTYSELNSVIRNIDSADNEEKSETAKYKPKIGNGISTIDKFLQEVSFSNNVGDFGMVAQPETKDFTHSVHPKTNELSVEARPEIKSKVVQKNVYDSTSPDCYHQKDKQRVKYKKASQYEKYHKALQYDIVPEYNHAQIQTLKLKSTGVNTKNPPRTVAVP